MTFIDVTKCFETMLQKHRHDRGETKDILRNRKKSDYRKTSAIITKNIVELERDLPYISCDDVPFLEKIRTISIDLNTLSVMRLSTSNDSQINHRRIVQDSLEDRIKKIRDQYTKQVRNSKRKERLAKRPVRRTMPSQTIEGMHVPENYLFNLFLSDVNLEKENISPPEEERFLAEALQLRQGLRSKF